MKHKKIVSAILVMSLLVCSASNLIRPVLAETDSDIEISTEMSTEGDILIESSGDDVVIESETANDDEDIAISEQRTDDVTISDVDTESSETDITITGTEQKSEDVTESEVDIEVSDNVDTEDIAIESKGSLAASVSKNDEKNTLNTGTETVLTVKAENNTEKSAVFKVYFTNVTEELSEDKSEWEAYLTQPALNMQAKGLDDECKLAVKIKDADGKEQDASLAFLKEVKDDVIVSRYAMMELPAGASTEFDMTIWSDANSTVTVIPVMEQQEAVYGEDESVTWEKKLTFFEKFISFFKGEDIVVEEETSDIEISDVQGVDVDMNGIEDSDFESMRLVILTEDASVITDTDNIIGVYGDLYLLQFGSVQETKNAYLRYKDVVTAVEPDKAIETATEVSEEITVESEDISEDVTVEETVENTDNPLTTLTNVEGSTDAQNERGVIALIDTGANEHTNVIDRVSVIDDVLVGNGHGDIMVDKIVSQDPNAKILSIRALDDNGFGTVSSLVAAMEYAIEQNVDYINLSLYARTTLTTSVLKQEIIKATEAGIIVIGAAGNDGVNVKDYVPGSVDEAIIIGSATTDGFKQVLSNYGDTVDYNVVANSTSEATALFTGYISAHGLDGVKDVLNQGFIYETDFAGDGIAVDTTHDVDLSDYEVDKSKRVIAKYSFVDASKLEDGDTLDSIFMSDRQYDMVFTTLMSAVEVYDMGDGTYKVKMNAPLVNGYAVSDYVDVQFARGNNNGEVVTEGVSFDKHTGIATIDASVLDESELKDYDFANLQCQVLIPADSIPERVMQNVTVVNNDGSEYEIKVPVYGLQLESIPLSIKGVESEITADDFEVYLNGQQTPVDALTWDADTHELLVDGEYAALIHSVKVVVKKDVDSVFKTAYTNGQFGSNTTYRSKSVMFYLPDGTDVSRLTVGKGVTKVSWVGVDGYPWMTELSNSYVIGTTYPYSNTNAGKWDNYVNHGGVDGDWSDKTGQIGVPKDLFGINFNMCNSSGTSYGSLSGVKDGSSNYNKVIWGYCHHIGSSVMNHESHMKEVYYQILDKWTSGEYTHFTMLMLTSQQVYSAQTLGGIVRFAVKEESKAGLSIQKQSADTSITSGNSNYSLAGAVYTIYSDSACTKKVTTITTNANGLAKTGDEALDAGTYYVKETIPSPGYDLDTTKYTFKLEGGKTASQNKQTSKEPPIGGLAKLQKVSTNPDMTDDNGCYSLKGAEYTIYTNKACTDAYKYKVMTTDENGNASLSGIPLGNYWVKETKASKGFELDDTVHAISFTKDNTSATIKSEEVPGNDPTGIQITKIWNGPQTATIPSLEGTQFTIKYYDGYYDTVAQVSGLTPKRTWVLEAKYNTNTKKYMVLLTETYRVAELSDAFYKDDSGTMTVIPYGTITIQETKEAPGYTLEGEFKDKQGNTHSPGDVYITQVTKDGGIVAIQGGNEYSMSNDPKPANIKLKKTDANGKALVGVEFTITDQDGNAVTDMNGTEISTVKTNSLGVAEFTNLYPNIYVITETKTVAGQQLLKDPITVYAPMRMTQAEATANNLDTSKAYWDDMEQVYLIFDQTYEVSNTPNFIMPMSGGIFDSRMLIPLGIGMVLLMGAFVLVFHKKRELE